MHVLFPCFHVCTLFSPYFSCCHSGSSKRNLSAKQKPDSVAPIPLPSLLVHHRPHLINLPTSFAYIVPSFTLKTTAYYILDETVFIFCFLNCPMKERLTVAMFSSTSTSETFYSLLSNSTHFTVSFQTRFANSLLKRTQTSSVTNSLASSVLFF